MFTTPAYKNIELKGCTGTLSENIIQNWLIGLREYDPAIIEMFKERDIIPYSNPLPWSGEFAGKYITGAYYIYKITRNKALFDYINAFIDELIETQAPDGYMGCFPKEFRLTDKRPNGKKVEDASWDCWNHYHIMFGLLLWYDETGKKSYYDAVLRCADLFLNTFYNSNKSLLSTGYSEMNFALYHVFAMLCFRTGEKKYLEFAKNIEDDFLTNALETI